MSDQGARLPPITTRVGRADWGDMRFVGRSVGRDVVGQLGVWDLAFLGLGLPLPSDADRALLDDLACCGIAADGRIWPMKVGRLVASHGSYSAGMAAAFAWVEGGLLGPWANVATARMLQALARELGDDCDDSERVQAAVRARLAKHERLPGFGVPLRPEDERVDWMRRAQERRGRKPGKHWRLMEHMAPVLLEQKRPVNLSAGFSAILLDLGLDLEQVFGVTLFVGYFSFSAHAFEGARQVSPALQRLPDEHVEYLGTAPRRSPRAG